MGRKPDLEDERLRAELLETVRGMEAHGLATPEEAAEVRALLKPDHESPPGMVGPHLSENMREQLADQELYRRAASRLADKTRAIDVDFDDL